MPLFTAIIPITVYAQESVEKLPFALVELYTSEGCSSCPVADQVLSALTHAAEQSRERVFTLSFHVDYWNYIGWTDPYSSAQNSNRQRQYTQTLKENSTFTPQMIINGQHSFGGYRGDLAAKHINAALDEEPPVGLKINSVTKKNGSLIIEYALSAIVSKSTLNFAVSEKELSQAVSTGENAGQILNHDNVVRKFISIPVTARTSSVTIENIPAINMKNSNLTVFVQDSVSLKILAADSTALNQI
jgi:hypothetical protein